MRYLLLRDGDPADRPGDPAPTDDPSTAATDPTPVRCAACGYLVTTTGARLAVDGAFEHTKVNPHGLVFVIVTYGEAPGCRPEGDVHHYWSWFPGKGWQIATCARCRTHLGWVFVSPAAASFHGLIVDRIEVG